MSTVYQVSGSNYTPQTARVPQSTTLATGGSVPPTVGQIWPRGNK